MLQWVFYISVKHIYMYDLWMWPWPTLYDTGSVVLPLVTEILPVSVSLTSKQSEWIYSSTWTCIYMHDKSLWILFISLHIFKEFFHLCQGMYGLCPLLITTCIKLWRILVGHTYCDKGFPLLGLLQSFITFSALADTCSF